MAVETPERTDIQELEEAAEERLGEEGIPPPEEPLEEEAAEPTLPAFRISLVMGASVLAAAVMTGGVFVELSARAWGILAGVLGILLAVFVRKIRRPVVLGLAIIGGLIGIGLLEVLFTGTDNLFGIRELVGNAVESGDVQRPPVRFDPGWMAIQAWLMASIAFAATWVALEVRKPALGLLLPLPVVAITAISVPESDQVVTGLICLVLFAAGLGILSGTHTEGEEGEKLPLAFEVRRALRAIPLLGVITAAVYFMSTQGWLFPAPLYDPTQEAQKPKTVPITEVEDRVLFRVDSSILGPWRMGHLDVYDGTDWRLPPFAQSALREVPPEGVVDTELTPGVSADFFVVDLGGAVLPGLPNSVGIVARGPELAWDPRLGNIRLAQGTIDPGLEYTVVAASVPAVEDIAEVDMGQLPEEIDGVPAEDLLFVPDPPPAVEGLLDEAPDSSAWERFDYMRQEFLDTVVSTGSGAPVAVPPEKVQDMLAGSQEGSPFEIVAAQAMMARWAGIPARIGYGFDGGDEQGGLLEVRPRHGASFVEVYFPVYKWLPVIGTPRQSASDLSSEFQQFNPNVAASDDVGVQILVPIATDPQDLLFRQVRAILAVVVPIIAGMLLLYYSWPAFRKTVARTRRRSWAQGEGAHARIALSYTEWRDTATDYGYRFEADTPLMFLDRMVEDDEHLEFAWLVTRTLWGDLRDSVTDDDASAAEELSRALRTRLAQAHPSTLRVIATVSRLSMRYPYAPALGPRAKPQPRVIMEPRHEPA